jgi:hypothetical protein
MADSNYLVHHGIKGQKWGVRRYQNSDGSLTDEGRRRYGFGGKRGLITENTKSRLKRGAKIGAAFGAVEGGFLGAVQGASLAGAAAAAGYGSLAVAGLTLNPVTAALVYGGMTALTEAAYAGALGASVGGVVGAVETHKGRKFIKRNDKGLKDFEKRAHN